MKKFTWFSAGSALIVAACFSVPAAAQTTVYNYGGGCAVVNGPSSSCTPAAGYGVTTQGWAAASGSNFVASTLTNQGGSGIGMSSGTETNAAPNHGIDNQDRNEVVLLNFGTNKVVLTDLAIGWLNTDSDIALYRWTGSTGPTMTTTEASHAGLVAKGWSLVADRDLDNNSAVQGDLGAQTWKYDNDTSAAVNLVNGTGIAVNSANASSWWLVAAYMGGGTQVSDTQKDYFKLLSVSATCVSGGGANNACGPTTNVPEPASLALVGVALLGALGTTRRRKTA